MPENKQLDDPGVPAVDGVHIQAQDLDMVEEDKRPILVR
jgi:hypothetical protein